MNKGIYQDKKTGKWYIHTTIKGKTFTKRGYNSKREADVDFDRAVNEWARDKGIDNKQTYLLKDLCDHYYSFRAVNMSQGTLHKDKSQEHKLLTKLGNIPVNLAFSFSVVRDFSTNLNKDYRLLAYYKSLMTFAYDRLLIDKDYSSLIVLPKSQVKKPNELKVIPPNTKQAFLEALKGNDEYFIMFTLFAYLGCRLSEFLGICYDCVDLERKEITIKKQLLTNGRLTEVLKTSNSYRTIPLNEEISSKILNKYGKKMAKCVKNQPESSKSFEHSRLFTISHTSFKRILKKYLPDYSSHCFRHTRASELGSKCENIGDVIFCAKWLGHSPSMFLNTYCHNISDKIDKKFLE